MWERRWKKEVVNTSWNTQTLSGFRYGIRSKEQREQKQREEKRITEQKKINDLVEIMSGSISSEYLPWYTGDTIVITNENSGAVVIQPWDELLYRNEVYWFQLLLWKELKGGKICKNNFENIEHGWIIDFYLSWTNNINDIQDTVMCNWQWYSHWWGVYAYNETGLNFANSQVNMDWSI